MSQVFQVKPNLLQEFGERDIEALEYLGTAARAGCPQRRGGSEPARLDPNVEHGETGSPVGDAIAMSVRRRQDARDDAARRDALEHAVDGQGGGRQSYSGGSRLRRAPFAAAAQRILVNATEHLVIPID